MSVNLEYLEKLLRYNPINSVTVRPVQGGSSSTWYRDKYVLELEKEGEVMLAQELLFQAKNIVKELRVLREMKRRVEEADWVADGDCDCYGYQPPDQIVAILAWVDEEMGV